MYTFSLPYLLNCSSQRFFFVFYFFLYHSFSLSFSLFLSIRLFPLSVLFYLMLWLKLLLIFSHSLLLRSLPHLIIYIEHHNDLKKKKKKFFTIFCVNGEKCISQNFFAKINWSLCNCAPNKATLKSSSGRNPHICASFRTNQNI